MASSVSQTQVSQLSSGLVQALAKIDANVSAQIWAETLPIVGDNFKTAADDGVAQLHFTKTIAAAIKAGIDSLVNSGDTNFTADQVETAINVALAAKGFTGLGVSADFSSASNLKLDFSVQHTGDAVDVGVEKDLGLPNLGLSTSGTAHATFDTSLHFGAGIDASGFYISTGPDTTFTINSDTTLPNFNSSTSFGGLGLTAINTPSDPPDFTGHFDIDLKDANADGKLRLSELSGDLLDAKLTGIADVNLDLSLNVPDNVALPKFTTSFSLDWNFNGAVVNPKDDNSEFGDTPNVQFSNSSLDLSSFFHGLAGQVLNEILQVTAPLKPVIDILTTPIPVLSDLGSSKVTLLDFAGLTPEETSAIEGLADIISLANELATYNPENVKIDLGSSSIDGDIRTAQGADIALSILRAPADLALQNNDLKAFLQGVEELGGGGLAFPILTDSRAIGKMLLGQDIDLFSYKTDFGFQEQFSQFFPVIGPVGVKLGGLFGLSAEFNFGFDLQGAKSYFASGATNAAKIFNGFYVQATDDQGGMATGFSIEAGILAALEANVGIASVGVGGDLTANVEFGLDAALADAFGKIRGTKLLNTPVADLFDPTGSLSGGLHAYLEFGVSPFSVDFSFDSPRFVLLNFDGDRSNPPIIASGLTGGVLALNIGDRSAERKIGNLEDIAEKVSIAKYIDPILGATGDVQVVGFNFTEKHAAPTKIVGNGGNQSDEIIVDSDVKVIGVLSGGSNRDILTGGAANDILSGDDGPDVLTGNGGRNKFFGGAGSDRMIGGADRDAFDGGDGLDTVSYKNALSGMTIDLRTRTFTGDGAGDSFVSVERYEGTDFGDVINGDDSSNSLLGGLAGDDVIHGFNGSDLLHGGKGEDQLFGDAGDDMLIGGEGADSLNGGGGNDTATYAQAKSPVSVSLLTKLGTQGDADGDQLTSIEFLIGSGLPFGDLSGRRDPFTGKFNVVGTGDVLEGSNNADVISGMGGADLIMGNGGNDTLYGDSKGASTSSDILNAFDADTLQGGDGNDQLYGQEGDDDLDGGAGADKLYGAEGNDHLRTMDLGSIDVLDGGTGFNRLSADYSDKNVAIEWIGGKTNDLTFADGDTEKNFQTLGELITGNLADKIVLDNSADDSYGNTLRTRGGNDNVRSGRGNDLVEAGSGKDIVYAGAGGDYVDGGAGDDFINGGSNPIKLIFANFGEVVGYTGTADELQGGEGIDTVSFDELRQTVTYIGIGNNSGKEFGLGVTVNLTDNTTGRAAIGIVIDGFENIIGTNYADDLTGNDLNNVFQPLRGGGLYTGGTSGPDRIDGRGGVDTLVIDFSLADLKRAAGVLTNQNSISRITVDQKENVDSYAYTNVERLHITGAGKADLLYSWVVSPGDDFFSGLAGDDRLGGGAGSDILLGGDGNDQLTGQGTFALGYDGVAGGIDKFDGGAGDDLVEDIALGGPTGTMLAGGARFELDGGSGFDILSADFSNQSKKILWSSDSPTDIVFGDGSYAKNFEQIRYFSGGSGSDEISQFGRVDNKLFGAAGDDVINPGLGTDYVDGGDGADVMVLNFADFDSDDLTGVTGGGGNVGSFVRKMVIGGEWIDSVHYLNVESLSVTGTSKADEMAGTIGDDIIQGGGGNDSLDGYFGGNDKLDGGGGDDIQLARTGNDRLIGGAGNDTLTGDYDFSSGFGMDDFAGGDGDDIISNISFSGGITRVQSGDRMKLDGGAGIDTLSADFGMQSQAINFTAGTSQSVDFADGSFFHNFERIGDLITGSGNDKIVQSGRFDNNIGVGDGNDSVDAGLGIDAVFGGAGDDLLIVNYANGDTSHLTGAVMFAGLNFIQRRDISTSDLADKVTFQNFERFQFTGGSKSDQFFGGIDNDVLSGGGGDDMLFGGLGNDELDGGRGQDTLDYSDKSVAVIVALSESGSDTATVGGLAEDVVKNFENVIGGFADDKLTGDSGNNELTGSDGSDILAGKGGADHFVFKSLFAGVDTILDFKSVDDTIQISAAGFGSGLVSGGTPLLMTVGDKAAASGSASGYFIYDNQGNDAGLYFDVNGGSGSDAVLFARLSGTPTVTVADIVLF